MLDRAVLQVTDSRSARRFDEGSVSYTYRPLYVYEIGAFRRVSGEEKQFPELLDAKLCWIHSTRALAILASNL